MRKILFICLAMLVPMLASAWGQKGHDVVAYIAEKHLSKRTLKRVTEVLDGNSLVYVANWMDNASHTPAYAYTKTWHYKNIDAGVAYEDAELEPNGDVVTAIHAQLQVLKDKASSIASRPKTSRFCM